MPAAEALRPYLERIDEARWYTNFGPLLVEFERRLSARFDPPAPVATVCSATTGLSIGLQALGVRRGGLCAMPSWTFVATAHAALQAGLEPWLVDVDPATWMLDPEALKRALGAAPGEVAAVVPVAPFGRMPEPGAWRRFQVDTGVPVLLDAAAAFDALHDASVPAVVSLHATKALGVGEGGFFAAEDFELVERFRQLTSFGFRGSRTSHVPAANAKLSEYAAAAGLASLDGWPAIRLRYLRTAQHLRIALATTPEVRFQAGWGVEWATSVCVVRLPDGTADAVEARLRTAGISTRRWWGHGCHREPAFAACPRAELPVTETLAASTLGVPFWPDMATEEIDRVAGALKEAVAAA
jgi:dTDP-4-amino-4,6-dideoxygalactose transaminase